MLSWVVFRASALALSAAALAGRVSSSTLTRADSFCSTPESWPGRCVSMCVWCVSRRFLMFSILALRPVIWLVTHRPSTLEQPEACALTCTPTLPAASSYCTTRPVSYRTSPLSPISSRIG